MSYDFINNMLECPYRVEVSLLIKLSHISAIMFVVFFGFLVFVVPCKEWDILFDFVTRHVENDWSGSGKLLIFFGGKGQIIIIIIII